MAVARVAVAGVGLAVLLAGCSTSEPGPTGPATAGSAPAGSAPTASLGADATAALTAELRQDRTQYADRTASLRVTNDSASDLVLLGGTVTAPGFAPTTPDGATDRPLPAGSGRDVRLRLGDVDCTTAPDDGEVRAVVRVAPDEGEAGGGAGSGDGDGAADPAAAEVEVPVTDPLGRLAAVHAEVCAERLVATGARLAVDDVEPAELPGQDGEPASGLRVTVRVTPVDGGPDVRLADVAGTTLLKPTDGEPLWTGAALEAVDGVVVLDALPARCDPHAVGEDKRGTFLPVTTAVDGVEQPVIYLPMTDEQRRRVFDTIHDACNWG